MTERKDKRQSNDVGESITQDMIKDRISKFELKPEVADWLNSEAGELQTLIQVFADNADVFGLHDDLKEDPLLILDTMLQSADTLHGYQEQYDHALRTLAETNGIVYDNLDDIAEQLQEVSIAREKEKIAEHRNAGGKIAIGILGSGASGKGTVAKRTGLERAVNTTTRFKRPGEEHGKDYYYLREMYPGTAESLDIDTGFNAVGVDAETNKPIWETDEQGNPVNYFDKEGPYVVTVHRPGRARHGTSVSEIEDKFRDNDTIFFEHATLQVQEAAQEMPQLIEGAQVLPVCIVPPRRGILPLASRIAARTYGDENHRDSEVADGYKIKDSYLDSTIGDNQIEEFALTREFSDPKYPFGVVYVVNDDLNEAVETFKSLIN